MARDQPLPVADAELDELTGLAQRFVDGKLFDEAVQLFEMALRLDPKNVGVQLSLAQVKRLRSRPGTRRRRSLRDSIREQIRRDALDAKHFLGLAWIYMDRGDDERAIEYLEISIAKDLPNPAPHKLYGRLLFRKQQYARAIIQLTTSRRFNPFDREVCVLLGRARYELGDFEGALASFIDGFLLLPDGRRFESMELKKRIQQLKETLRWSTDRLSHLFRQRQDQLKLSFDRLEFHRERFHEETLTADLTTLSPPKGDGRLELASRLRQLEPWTHLTDEQIFALTRVAHLEERERNELVFAHGTVGSDLYVLERGEITIERETPYGSFPLGLLKPGDLFGEVNFITRGERTADALASQPCQLIRLDGHELDKVVRRDPELGVQLYWSFWHGLAFKLRCTNEQLRTFFSDESLPENFLQLGRSGDQGEVVDVDSETKMQLLREQGLNNRELMTLAGFSQERQYAGGATIFHEGDVGNEMFIVLEGKIRISKQIPGAGEEALAILSRGDFFGEMALIDGQPRSADARVHGGRATVIALEEETIREVLAADPEACLEFLQLLCRLIAKRLGEIDEKVIGWRIMAGVAAPASA